MYLSKDPRDHHETYFQLVRALVEAAPSTWPYIEDINNYILTGEIYKALKQTKKLIEYEQELIEHAKGRGRLPVGSEGNRKSA
jgi:flagellar protein FlbT